MRFLMLNWRDPKNPLAGGAERVTLRYLSALVERGHDVSWFAHGVVGAPAEEAIEGISIVRNGGSGTCILKARQWYQRQARFDLVIDQHHGIPWLAPWWSHTRCVAYIHEVLGPIWSSFYRWPVSLVGRGQERVGHWLYRRVPFWVPSESTRKALLARGVQEVTVMPNGVDTKALAALEPQRPDPPWRLVAVSRLAPNKRIDHAIQALHLLHNAGCDVGLTIVGAGGSLKPLQQLVTHLQLEGKVTFVGGLSEDRKNELLRHSHVLLHPSVREGWGLNVIEANAMGTPAVVYPVAGLVDSTVHGETGLVTAAETPEAMAVSIRRLLESPEEYQRLRLNAWNRAKSFHWDRVLPAACDWLERQASGTHGGRP